MAADVHDALKIIIPDLLTIIAPRHPRRSDAIEKEIARSGTLTRRSAGGAPTGDIHLWDTLGEMGSLYNSVPVTVMGGSFMPIGGHNPIEPAQFGNAIICGPHMHNFSAILDAFVEKNAILQVRDAGDLAQALEKLFLDKARIRELGAAALRVCDVQAASLPRLWDALAAWRRQVQEQVQKESAA